MAINLINGQILRERVICYDQGSTQVGINVIHLEVTNVTGNPTDADVASARAQAHATAYKTWMCNRSSYRGVGIKILGPGAQFPEVLNGDFAGVGLSGTQQLPLQVSGLIRIRTSQYNTGETGKKYSLQGRFYPPFPSRQWSDDEGQMTDAGRAALAGIASTFPLSTTIIGTGGTVDVKVIVVPANPALLKGNASQIIALYGFATQRRRGDFGKTNTNPIP